jgi:hypothetical protein
MRKADLLALAERVEKASEGSRELDSAIYQILYENVPAEDRMTFGEGKDAELCRRDQTDAIAFISPSQFTTSVDVASAFIGEIVHRAIKPHDKGRSG